jgi:hypothetical protein
MSENTAASSSVRLGDLSVGDDNAALFESSQLAEETQVAVLKEALSQHRNLIQATSALADRKIQKVNDNVKIVAEHTSNRDARRKAHLERHDGLHQETMGRVDQHAENLQTYGDRLESLEKAHKSTMVPAIWALSAVGVTTLFALIVWGASKLFGGKKKKEISRESDALSTDDETDYDDDEDDEPVGRRRTRGRRVHARAWQVAPELGGEMWSEEY